MRRGVCVCATVTEDRSRGTNGFVLLTTKALSKKNPDFFGEPEYRPAALQPTGTRAPVTLGGASPAPAMRDEQLKMMSLLVFTFQNAAFVLLMRWSKVLDTHYNSTVAVFLTEVRSQDTPRILQASLC